MQTNFTVSTVAFLQGIGTTELLIIFFAILLLFGAKKLPELARGMGKSIKEFKKATSEVEEDFRSAMDSVDPDKPVQASSVPAADGENKIAPPVKEES